MAAQSPTLSTTLSAIVASLRGFFLRASLSLPFRSPVLSFLFGLGEDAARRPA